MSHHGPPATVASSTFYLSSTCTTVVATSCTTSVLDQAKHANFDENSPRPPVLGEEHEPREGSMTPGSNWGMCGGGPRHSPSFTPRRVTGHQNTTFCRESDAPLGFEPEGSERVASGSFVELGTPPYLRWAISLASLLEDPEGRALFQKYLEGESSIDMLNFFFACEGLKNAPREDANVAQLVRLIHKRYFKASNSLKVSEALRREVHRRVREVTRGEGPPDRRLFDEAQKQVEIFLNNTAYPEFLRSELYVQHVRAMQSGLVAGRISAGVGGGGSEEESSSSSSSVGKEISTPMGMLPTLHEDAELEVEPHSHHHHRHHSQQDADLAALPLTRDMLIATQRKRAQELRPKPEAYARLCLQQSACSSGSPLPNPYHMPSMHHRGGSCAPGLNYSSYNPVSRQDSELQSLSSDAHTEDSASVTNSSLDGGSVYRNSRRHHVHSRQIRESANCNRDPHMHQTIIPRTQRIPKENLQPMKPDEFAAILIQKLENVQKYQEIQEKLERKLQEGDIVDEEAMAAEGTQLLSEGIRGLQVDTSPPSLAERMQFTDDSNQAILDMHVSRVWSDLTPSRSPSLISPRPRSPEGRRRITQPGYLPLSGGIPTLQPAPSPLTTSQVFPGGLPISFQTRMGHGIRHTRKEKDGVSTLSSDSGNVHDYPESLEHKHSHHYLPKSKSMPDYVEAQKQDSYSGQGHESSRLFVKDMARKPGSGGSRKTLTDLTDSGVSVVSDTCPCPATKDSSRVLSWLVQSEARQAGYSHGDVRHKGRSSGASGSSASNLQRQARSSKKSAGSSGSRSDSVERGSVAAPMAASSWSHSPAQPFMADPSMPLLPLPHTATQLEEARRRLEDVRGNTKGGSSRQRFLSSSKTLLSCGPSLSLPISPSAEPAGSGQSSLRRHAATPTSCTSTLGRTPASQPQQVSTSQPTVSGHTTVMFSFCDEEVPYRTKVPGKQVTLRQFKEILPKRGNYRYFFKTECEDFDTRVIHEEVMDDSEILPLWEGKIMAQVKPVE